jgi:exopolysaccharide biosynthesis polyprenyl glycosylphosphotransferase
MKKIDQIFNYLVLPTDLLMVFLAFLVSYWVRANAIPFSVVYIWPFDQYVTFALSMLPVWIVALFVAGTYSKRKPSFWELPQVIAGSSLGSMAVVLWVFIFRSDFFSRLIVFYIWILAIVFIFIGRAILAGIHLITYRIGDYKRKVIVIGNNDPTTTHIVAEIATQKGNKYFLEGVVSPVKTEDTEIKYLGKPEDFQKILGKSKVDEVVLTDTSYPNEKIYEFLLACQEKSVIFKAVPAHAQVGMRTLEFDAFAGIPIIEFRGTPLGGWGSLLKRAMDLIGSIIALIILSPVILIISIIIKMTSAGPVIYKNIRVGRGKEFITYKFRTMYTEHCTGSEYGGSRAEKLEKELIEKQNIKKGSAVYKIINDPRITPVGRFLREKSLDELPQFYNVLIGNMSLVGPRPHQPREVANYTREQRKTLLVKPGISGLAQISGRSDLTFDEEARLDIYYIENWSFWLDIYIAFKTFGAAFWGKGTY